MKVASYRPIHINNINEHEMWKIRILNGHFHGLTSWERGKEKTGQTASYNHSFSQTQGCQGRKKVHFIGPKSVVTKGTWIVRKEETRITTFSRAEERVNYEGRNRACECGYKWMLKLHSSACLRITARIYICRQEINLFEFINSVSSDEIICGIYLT